MEAKIFWSGFSQMLVSLKVGSKHMLQPPCMLGMLGACWCLDRGDGTSPRIWGKGKMGVQGTLTRGGSLGRAQWDRSRRHVTRCVSVEDVISVSLCLLFLWHCQYTLFILWGLLAPQHPTPQHI